MVLLQGDAPQHAPHCCRSERASSARRWFTNYIEKIAFLRLPTQFVCGFLMDVVRFDPQQWTNRLVNVRKQAPHGVFPLCVFLCMVLYTVKSFYCQVRIDESVKYVSGRWSCPNATEESDYFSIISRNTISWMPFKTKIHRLCSRLKLLVPVSIYSLKSIKSNILWILRS